MGNRKYNTEIVRELLKQKNIELIGEYISYKENIKLKCLVCGLVWDTRAENVLTKNRGGSGCHRCHKVYRRTHEEFIEELKEANPDIEVLGVYEKAIKPIKIKCKKCGYIWETTPNSLLKGHGCGKCKGLLKKTNYTFSLALKNKNPNIELIGDYITARKPVKVRCKLCGHEWETTAVNLITSNPKGCPICFQSKGEREIVRICQKYNIPYISQFSPPFALGCRHDFLLFNNVLVEFDGIQHFEEVKKGWISSSLEERRKIDNFKDKIANENGYRIVRISYSSVDCLEEEIPLLNIWDNKKLLIGKEYYTETYIKYNEI